MMKFLLRAVRRDGRRGVWLSTLVAIGVVATSGQAVQRADRVYDDDVVIQGYEPMIHPGPFDSSGEGLVVLRLELDARGRTTDARAISGRKALISAAVANAKRLNVAAQGRLEAVVIYEFRTAEACFDINSWVTGNVVTAVGCDRAW